YMEEAERLCDRVIIVDQGRIVADGAPSALIASASAVQLIELGTEPPLPPSALADLPGVRGVAQQGTAIQLSVGELKLTLPALLEAVKAGGASLVHLSTRAGTLDDVFLALTGRHLRDDGAPAS